MGKLAEKQKQLSDLRTEVLKLEQAQRTRKEYPKYKKMIGKYFKFRNSYSCPKEESDYWWIYAFVEGALPSKGIIIMRQMQVDSNGELRVKPNHEMHWQYLQNWVPCKKEEFQAAINRANSIISGMQEKDMF